MKLKQIWELLDDKSRIELRSCYEDKKLLKEYNSKEDIEGKYLHTDVVEISQSGDLYLVLYLNRVE